MLKETIIKIIMLLELVLINLRINYTTFLSEFRQFFYKQETIISWLFLQPLCLPFSFNASKAEISEFSLIK